MFTKELRLEEIPNNNNLIIYMFLIGFNNNIAKKNLQVERIFNISIC